MRPRRVLATQDTAEIIDRAVQERALAVLTLQDGDNEWQTFKSRFLERDRRNRYFVLDYLPCDDQPLPPLAPGHYLGVSFRQRSRKLLFATVVEARGRFMIDQNTSIPAVRYRWPDSMTELQRRAYHRTPVPDGTVLPVAVWSGGANARTVAQTEPRSIITGELADLSCGGALLRLGQADMPPWRDDQTVGLELHLPDGRPPLVIDGRYRGSRQDETGQVCAAIQFIGLELTVDGRAVLQRLANSVQRLHRLGLAAGRDYGRQYPP